MRDAIITNKNDELYDLQEKYNVKISRSNSSDAVYIWRNNKFKVRIGHPISKNQNHIWNFDINEVTKERVGRGIVEKVIKMYF